MRLWKSEPCTDTLWIAVGEGERHLDMRTMTGQNVKHVGRWIHPDVFADVAHRGTMGFVGPDGFQASVGVGAFKLQSPAFYEAANGRWKGVHTRARDYDYADGGGLVK